LFSLVVPGDFEKLRREIEQLRADNISTSAALRAQRARADRAEEVAKLQSVKQ
jgi:hypothetical protein